METEKAYEDLGLEMTHYYYFPLILLAKLSHMNELEVKEGRKVGYDPPLWKKFQSHRQRA